MEFTITYTYNGDGSKGNTATVIAKNETKARNKFGNKFSNCEITDVNPK